MPRLDILQSCADSLMSQQSDFSEFRYQFDFFKSPLEIYRALLCSRVPCSYCKANNTRQCLERIGWNGKVSEEDVETRERALLYEDCFPDSLEEY